MTKHRKLALILHDNGIDSAASCIDYVETSPLVDPQDATGQLGGAGPNTTGSVRNLSQRFGCTRGSWGRRCGDNPKDLPHVLGVNPIALLEVVKSDGRGSVEH